VETARLDVNMNAREVVKLVAIQVARMIVREVAIPHVDHHAQELVKILVVMVVHELVINNGLIASW
jgi:hypothetical protein